MVLHRVIIGMQRRFLFQRGLRSLWKPVLQPLLWLIPLICTTIGVVFGMAHYQRFTDPPHTVAPPIPEPFVQHAVASYCWHAPVYDGYHEYQYVLLARGIVLQWVSTPIHLFLPPKQAHQFNQHLAGGFLLGAETRMTIPNQTLELSFGPPAGQRYPIIARDGTQRATAGIFRVPRDVPFTEANSTGYQVTISHIAEYIRQVTRLWFSTACIPIQVCCADMHRTVDSLVLNGARLCDLTIQPN
jgi:hypothetical protein